MRRLKISKTSPVTISTFLITYVSILLMKRDMWDGSIISYAIKTQDYRGIHSWFFSMGWPIQYFEITSTDWIANFIGVDYKHLDALWISLSIFIIVGSTYEFCLKGLGLEKKLALFASGGVISFPIWSFLFSYVMTLHFTCLALGLWSINKILFSDRRIWLYVIFFLFSLQLSSLILFLPVLTFLVYLRKRTSAKKLYTVATISLTYYLLVVAVFFRPSGDFTNYNSPLYSIKNGISREALIPGFKSFATYGFSSVLILLLLILNTSRIIRFHKKRSIAITALSCVILIVASIAPYILVGKYSVVLEGDWRSRHAILLGVGGPICVALILELMIKTKIHNILIIFSSVTFLFLNSSFLMLEIGKKIERSTVDGQIVRALKHLPEAVPAGKIIMQLPFDPHPSYRCYEANYLVWSSFGRKALDYNASFQTPTTTPQICNHTPFSIPQTTLFNRGLPDCETVIHLSKAIQYPTGVDDRKFWNYPPLEARIISLNCNK